jgi:hypothetical protein
MSNLTQEDIDRVVGRLVREKNANLRHQAAVECELHDGLQAVREAVERTFRGLAGGHDSMSISEGLEPMRQYSVDTLCGLFQERECVKARVQDVRKRLQDVGAE